MQLREHILSYQALLEYRVEAGDVEAVARLLPKIHKEELPREDDSSMDPWYTDMMFRAMHTSQSIPLLTLLKEYGADFNVKSIDGNTLLNLAIQKLGYDDNHNLKKLELLDYLLRNGADPLISDIAGNSPLRILMEIHDSKTLENEVFESVIDRLMQYGLNINAKNNRGYTAFHLPVMMQDHPAIDLLIRYGADMNCQDNQGRTPLYFAVSHGDPSTVKFLLDKKADATLKTNKGLSLLQIVEEKLKDIKNQPFSEVFAKERDDSINQYENIQKILIEWDLKHKNRDKTQPHSFYNRSKRTILPRFKLPQSNEENSIEKRNENKL